MVSELDLVQRGVTAVVVTTSSVDEPLPPGEYVRLMWSNPGPGVDDRCWVNFGVGSATAAAGAANVYSTGVLTFASTVTSGDTVTIKGIVYTFRTALSVPAVPYEVLIGANQAASEANLTAAINGSGVAGTNYSLGTQANPYVTAVDGAGTVTVTARVLDASTTTWATTETGAQLSWGATTLGDATINNNFLVSNLVPCYVRVPEIGGQKATFIAAVGTEGGAGILSVVGYSRA